MRNCRVLIKFTLLPLFVCDFYAKAATSYSQFCLHSPVSVVKWLAYPPEIQRDTVHKNITGDLVKYMAKVLPSCCPSAKLTYSQMNVTSSEEVEMLIRKDKSSHLSLYFPVFANKKETEQYQRPFYGLYNSPGPAVLVPMDGNGETQGSFGVSAVRKSWRLLLFAFVMAAGFGIITWFLVRFTIGQVLVNNSDIYLKIKMLYKELWKERNSNENKHKL